MPWHFRGAVGDSPIICTGPDCKDGYIPCPVDHDAQPLNEEWQGERFFRCDECDWVIPDEFGENRYETAGRVTCPECGAGDRNDTYDGPCDFCHKKSRPATNRTFPADVLPFLKTRRCWYSSGNVHTCNPCFTGKTLELRKELEQIEQQRAYNAANRDKPVGTCDRCLRPDYLALAGPDLFVCVRCIEKTAAAIPQQRQAAEDAPQELPAPAYTAADCEDPDDYDPEDVPPSGWYDDPEGEDGYLRWWSGTEWVGGPVHPDHVATT